MKAWENPRTPLERAKSIGCPVITCFRVEGSNPSPEGVAKICRELARNGNAHQLHPCLDTGHALRSFPGLARYRTRAAQDSWTEILPFLGQPLA